MVAVALVAGVYGLAVVPLAAGVYGLVARVAAVAV